jgi:hypothetical protein
MGPIPFVKHSPTGPTGGHSLEQCMRHSFGRPPNRLTPARRLKVGLVTLTALAAGSLAAAIGASLAAPSANLITNPGFEQALTGWSALTLPQHLDVVVGGHQSSHAAKLWSTAAGTVVLTASPNPPPTTRAGAVYHASIWAATTTPDVVAVLQVGEVRGSVLVSTRSRQLRLTSPGWHQIGLDYTAVADGDQMTFSVLARNLQPGHSLLVDDAWLSVTSTPPTPTGSTPGPSPSTNPPTPTISPSTTPVTPTPTVTGSSPSSTPSSGPTGVSPGAWPSTTLHYAANGNISGAGQYLPGADGFNLADVGSVDETNALPPGVLALVWVGTCDGATPGFQSLVDGFSGNPKLFGFYLMDEPYTSSCPPANLKAESDWIHGHVPGAKTFIIMVNMGPSTAPTFAGTYTPANSGLDLVGLDPYPVRTELTTADYGAIANYAAAAQAAGWPLSSLVPVYQAFGGGTQVDDGGGHWQLPTAAQELTILADWAAVTPTPVFDYAYSWGSQSGDTALGGSPDLQTVFQLKQPGTP